MKKRMLSFLLAMVMLLTMLPHLATEAKAHQIVMTAEEFIDCLWTAHNRPNVYRNVYPYNLGYYDGNVIYFDCWNLGKAIIWSKGAIVNNYTVGHHASMDTSCGLGDWDGLTIVKEAPNCSTDFSNLVPGEWLYMNNHTGYYVGDGQVIECTAGWDVWCITVSQIDQYGNRSRNGVANGRWVYHGMVPWLDYEASKDDEKPVISDLVYSNVSASGYTVSCKVTDNRGVSKVAFPTWTLKNGQDDLAANFLNTQLGTKNGDTYTFRVNTSDHNNETGDYATHIYAFDRAGNMSKLEPPHIQVRNDTQNPVISDVVYSDVSTAGYTVSCKVTDDWGVHSVAFPTWTIHNGQDDLPDQFFTTQLGTKNGDRYTFRVKASEHNNETGTYVTHIYATDCAGNRVSLPLSNVEVRNDTTNPVISDAVISNVTASGYTVTCKVTDDWGVNTVAFPTWTNANGQDDLADQFMKTQVGTKNGDTYTFQVKISDHNNEKGFYTTHIYAKDCAGNTISLALDSVEVKDPTTVEPTDPPVVEPTLKEITLTTSSKYAIDKKMVSNIAANTSVAALLTQFQNETLEVVDNKGKVLSGSALVGTGAKINLYENNKLIDSVTVVILGDVDGNGIVDTTDVVRVKAAFLGTFTLSDAETLAADVDKSGVIDTTDYMRVKSHFIGTYDLYE